MLFKEKIDKLLAANELGINSVHALEKHAGASVGAVSKYYNANEEPGLGTIKKIKKAFDLSDGQWKDGDFGKPKVKDQPTNNYVDRLIQTLENTLASKDQEIHWLRKHCDEITLGFSTIKQTK